MDRTFPTPEEAAREEDPVRGALGDATTWDPPSVRWDVEQPELRPPPGPHERGW